MVMRKTEQRSIHWRVHGTWMRAIHKWTTGQISSRPRQISRLSAGLIEGYRIPMSLPWSGHRRPPWSARIRDVDHDRSQSSTARHRRRSINGEQRGDRASYERVRVSQPGASSGKRSPVSSHWPSRAPALKNRAFERVCHGDRPTPGDRLKQLGGWCFSKSASRHESITGVGTLWGLRTNDLIGHDGDS